MKRSRLFFFLLIGLPLTSCQLYRPQPLTSTTVQHALTPPSAANLRVCAQQLKHPILQPVELDFDNGLSPDAAAVLAVLLNPGLRAVRDQRGLADAQLIQAGLLPNPQVSSSLDKPAFGNTAGTVTAYGFGLSWDTQQLITRASNVRSARRQRQAVELDVAWQEWQAAQAAKIAVYQLCVVEAQLRLASEEDRRLSDNLDAIRRAAAGGQMTELDLSAAETASNQGHDRFLTLQQQSAAQRLELNHLLGLPADEKLRLQSDIKLPSHLELPATAGLLDGLEQRRLDLIALRAGYESQEAAVRAAILAQFPKISLGGNRMRDTSNVGSYGLAVTMDLPIFDRNQGMIARERATRQKLFDEYVNRVFEARADIARLLEEGQSLNEQIENATGAEPGLERLVRAYRIAADGGQADVLSYYTAWNNLAEQRSKILSLEQQLMQTRISLELASGLYRLEALDKDKRDK